MIAAVINAFAVALGAAIGMLFGKRIKPAYGETIMAALGLCTMVIDITNAIKTNDIIVVILCLVFGTLIGEILNFEGKINRFAERVENKFTKNAGENHDFSQGFVSASLLFCVGSMAITGSLQAGIAQDYQIIFSKSVMDFVAAITIAAALGGGVFLSALSVLVYQGAITLLATLLAPLLSAEIIVEMSAVGGVTLIGMALNMLKLGKPIRLANMLPALILPVVILPLMNLLASLF